MSDPLIYTGLGAKELVTTTFPVDGGVTQDMIELGAAALGTRPAGWLTPDHVSVTDGVCVASVWVGNAHAINPPSGSYLLWRRVVDTDGQILIAESTDIRFVVVNDLGAPLPSTPTYVTGLTSDDGSVVIGGTAAVPDLSVSGGGGAVESVNGQTGVVELTAGDVGADTAAARDAAITTEASTRVAGDAVNATAITNEAARAISVEAAKADLVTGKVPTSQLPAMALFKITAVANQAAMLALPAGESYLVSRTDNGRRFMLDSATDPTVLGNWILVDTDPSAAVDTVNGQTGMVVLAASDVGADTAAARDTAIGVETARAEAAESANASAITAETTRATTAEGTKATSIALAAEVVRATAGEGAAQSAAIAAAAADATSKANAAQAASQPLDPDLTAIGGLDSTQSGVVASDGAGWLRRSYAALKTALGLVKADVGLGSVDNTADSAKPVSTAQAAADAAVQAFAVQRANHTGTQAESTVTGLVADLATNATAITNEAARATTAEGLAAQKSANLSDLANASTARTNLGLGTAAVANRVGAGSAGVLDATDATTTNARTPTAHATTHASAGSDPVTLAESQVTNLTTDLAGKVPTSRQVASGTGLTGGGDLSADRTLAVSYGTTAGTAAQGNDSRITGAAQALTRTAKTGNYTAALGDLVACDTSGGAFTVTLPAASGGKGRIAIKLVTAGNTLNLALTGSDHFNTSAGPTTGTLTLANQGIVVESDGTSIWTVTADDLSLTVLDARYPAGLFPKPDSGDWITSQFACNDATSANSLNDMGCMPIYISQTTTFNSIAITVNTAAASAVIRLGIYGSTAGNKPGSLILDAGTVSSATTGVKQATISQQLTPGLYWLAAATQVALSQWRCWATAQGIGPFLALSNSNLVIQTPGKNWYKATGISGALPSTPTWGFIGNVGGLVAPIIGLVAA